MTPSPRRAELDLVDGALLFGRDESCSAAVLTDFDDFLCHQTVDPIAIPFTEDHRFYARYFCTAYDASGDICMITGLGNYPNSGVQDGFALLVTGDEHQRNLRVSRHLRGDAHILSTGPLGIEVVDPLRSFRMWCDQNEFGFAYDITCTTTSPPWERRRRFGPRVNGRVNDIGNHFNQGYRCEGWIEVDGERHVVRPDHWSGVRDRSWGIGRFDEPESGIRVHPWASQTSEMVTDRGPYGQGGNPFGGAFGHHNSWVPFSGDSDAPYLALSFRPHVHTIGGSFMAPWGRSPSTMIVGLERREVEFDGDEFVGCELELIDERARSHVMTVRRLTKVLEGGAGYADMGTGFAMGKPPTQELLVEGESISSAEMKAHLANKQVLGASSTFVAFHVCEYRWGGRIGYGSFEADQFEVAQLPAVRYTPAAVLHDLTETYDWEQYVR